MKNGRKALASLLVVVLLLSALPMGVMASTVDFWSTTSAYLDLTGYLSGELSAFPAAEVLSKLTDDSGNPITIEGDIAAYAKYSYYDVNGNYIGSEQRESYILVGEDGTMDLSCERDSFYSSKMNLSLIVGSNDQLALDNRIINVQVTLPGFRQIEAHMWDSNEETLEVASAGYGFSTSGTDIIFQDIVLPGGEDGWKIGDPMYLQMDVSQYTAQGLAVEVYEGLYSTEAELTGAENIAASIVDDRMYLENYRYSLYVTLVLRRGDSSEILPLWIYLEEAVPSVSWSYYKEDGSYLSWDHSFYSDDYSVHSIMLSPEESVMNPIKIRMRYSDIYDNWTTGAERIEKAVVGNFADLESAAEAEDIKEQLFAETYGEGYLWNFGRDGKLELTIFDKDGYIIHEALNFVDYSGELPSEEPVQDPESSDIYFRMNRAYTVYDISCDTYVMPYDEDSYYYNGYQTLFLLNRTGGSVQDAELIPYFSTGYEAQIYRSEDGGSGVRQISGETPVTVTYGQPLQYSAAAEDGENLKNYWVTFVTQEEGPVLFVNGASNSAHIDEESGLPVREVYLDSLRDYHHDIFFGNIGTEPLTGLKVWLSDDTTGVKLDEFWTVRDDSIATLNPFDSTYTYSMDNFARVRLVPEDQNSFAAISGTMMVYACDNDTVAIKLTGTAGSPEIITDSINPAVKYVPYASLIQTNYMGTVTDAISFSISNGALPAGVTLKPNGEIYGVPTESGTFTFTVKAAYTEDPSVYDTAVYVLVVATNSSENVENATDMAYKLIDRVPDEVTIAEDKLFHSIGEYGEFIDFWLDGRKLTDGVDYQSENGSTKITIFEQTFVGIENGEHTIAAEFRVNGDEEGELKKVAQNFTLNITIVPLVIPEEVQEPSPKPSPEPDEVPANTAEKAPAHTVFDDVDEVDWFSEDVDWVWQKDIMIGVSNTEFAPDGIMDSATIVTVLARTLGVDLKQFENVTVPGVPAGEWYSAAAAWAIRAGLLERVSNSEPFARGDMAVLLLNYLKSIGINCELTGEPVEFTDADEMTEEQQTAFQVLYQFGIFKGVGNNTMDVQGNTTRAQLAALMHRLYDFIYSKI